MLHNIICRKLNPQEYLKGVFYCSMQGTTFMDELFCSEPYVVGPRRGPPTHDRHEDIQGPNFLDSVVEVSYNLHVLIQFSFINLNL